MAHIHQWRVTHYTLLTLPDVHGYADRFMAWRCVTCGAADALAGCVWWREPLHSPSWWVAQAGVRTIPPQGAGPWGPRRSEVAYVASPRP